MAARQQQQLSGDGFTSQIAGMSKSQLYEIMSQMKVLIDQNQKQARQILIENPVLTRALFQAQIMLGMVQPPQLIPSIHSQTSSPSAPSTAHKSAVHTAQSLPSPKSSSQPPVSANRQQLPQFQPISIPSATPPVIPPAVSTANYQPNSFFSNFVGPPPPQPTQMRNHPPPAHSHYPMLQTPLQANSGQVPPSLQATGMFHQPLQPPLPPQPRPAMLPFSHQLSASSQIPHSLSFQAQNVPQHLFPPPLFHSGGLPPSSFPQGQPPLPNLPPPQQLYQGGGGLQNNSDYRNPPGISMHAERSPWMPGLAEKIAAGPPPGSFQPPLGHIATAPISQMPRLPLLSPEMEKAVLQQVLMLTPDQINLLPPEQRNQVLEIQEILR